MAQSLLLFLLIQKVNKTNEIGKNHIFGVFSINSEY